MRVMEPTRCRHRISWCPRANQGDCCGTKPTGDAPNLASSQKSTGAVPRIVPESHFGSRWLHRTCEDPVKTTRSPALNLSLLHPSIPRGVECVPTFGGVFARLTSQRIIREAAALGNLLSPVSPRTHYVLLYTHGDTPSNLKAALPGSRATHWSLLFLFFLERMRRTDTGQFVSPWPCVEDIKATCMI